MDWLTVELISIIVVLIGGFGTVSYQIGGWRRVIEETRDHLADHVMHCRESGNKIEERLERGGAAITRLEEQMKNLKEAVADVKDLLKERK